MRKLKYDMLKIIKFIIINKYSYHLLGSYYVPETVSTTLQILVHSIPQ